MREILFRGKRVDSGEWVEGCFLYGVGWKKGKVFVLPNVENLAYCKGCDPLDGYEVIPETVGQFTGLTDKNGTKIFEGDVITCRKYIGGNFVEYCMERGYVEFIYGAFGLHRMQGFYRPFKDWLQDYEHEVIGNIHDNPELLTV